MHTYIVDQRAYSGSIPPPSPGHLPPPPLSSSPPKHAPRPPQIPHPPPHLHLLKHLQGAVARVPVLRERAARWWEAERMCAERLRADGDVRAAERGWSWGSSSFPSHFPLSTTRDTHPRARRLPEDTFRLTLEFYTSCLSATIPPWPSPSGSPAPSLPGPILMACSTRHRRARRIHEGIL